jgi:hypothetical protein
MRLSAAPRLILVLTALLIGGCSEVTTSTDNAPVTVTVTEWPGASAPLEDVELCQTGTTNCVRTDSDGKATLYLPLEVETSFTRSKPSYAPYLVPVVVPATGTAFRLSMAVDDRVAEQHENVMSPYPMVGTGTILVGLAPRVEGATIDLFGATGTRWFMDENLDWRLDLAATTGRGTGGFTEVGPGDDYRVELGGTADGCVVEKGWPGPFENTVRFPVRAGYLIDLRMLCP